MPHPKRDDRPGARHHVWSRGASRRTIAEHRKEIRFLLSLLAREVRAGRIYVFSFVIMTNHLHGVFESRTGELSLVLQNALSQHVRRFNHPRGRSGALFSGRFKSRPVTCIRDGRGLNAYVHWNPVKAKMEDRPEDYEYSSAYYLGEDRRAPLWLRKGWEAVPELRPTLKPPANDATWRLLEARATARGDREDPLGDLVRASPRHVREWFRQRAIVADEGNLLLPVADPQAILAVCDVQAQAGPPLKANPSGRRSRDAWPLVRAALLRELCGLRWREIAHRLRVAPNSARELHEAHARCLLTDAGYAERFALVAARCLGTTEL